MNELVFVKKNDVFTDSLKIANGVKLEHKSVRRILDKYKDDFLDCGELEFSDFKSLNSGRGRPEKIYYLNEEQALLLITYLKNVPRVRAFKKNLVKAFCRMRKLLLERSTEEYKKFRTVDKEHQKAQMSRLAHLKDPKKYIKANTIANKATSMAFGEGKMIKKQAMTAEMLGFREKILADSVSLMRARELGIEIPSVSRVIYTNMALCLEAS